MRKRPIGNVLVAVLDTALTGASGEPKMLSRRSSTARTVSTTTPMSTLREVEAMAKCDTCGNDYDKSFQITMLGKQFTFDSFECAIHALAPTCSHCSVRIVGHGLESNGRMFCCDHCATKSGVTELRDRT